MHNKLKKTSKPAHTLINTQKFEIGYNEFVCKLSLLNSLGGPSGVATHS